MSPCLMGHFKSLGLSTLILLDIYDKLYKIYFLVPVDPPGPASQDVLTTVRTSIKKSQRIIKNSLN